VWPCECADLLIGRELLLRRRIDFDHRLRERLGLRAQRRHELEQSAIEGAVDLAQRRNGGEIDEEQRGVAQESRRQRHAAGIRRRVARADELDAVELDEGQIRRAPESTVFGDLAEERDHGHGLILVHRRKVDLVAAERRGATRGIQHTRMNNRAVGQLHASRSALPSPPTPQRCTDKMTSHFDAMTGRMTSPFGVRSTFA